jgi:octaprenyl-diphosphate synthase
MPNTSNHGSGHVNAQDFAAVFAQLKPHMIALDIFLRGQLSAFEPEIREMADYCIDTSGKRIRPALVFLAGWNEGALSSSDLVRVAAVVELVHLATLVHDDIMDAADLRRSRRTASKQYGPEAAVLLGDALFAHALHLASQFPTPEVCHAVSDSTRKVCAGEIVQTLRRGTTNITREDYFRVIDLKTAELFRVSCFLGARMSGFGDAFVNAATAFGRHLGIAYQIYDDLADFFGQETRIGKTLGTDLQSGKVTLPLLVLLERLHGEDRSHLVDEILKRREADLPSRIRQMTDLGVFSAVAEEIEKELGKAEAALMPYAALTPAALLRQLCDTLRHQVRNLQGPHGV